MKKDNIERFAILLPDEEVRDKLLIETVRKTSLRKLVKFCRVKIQGNKRPAFIIYNVDKAYMFKVAANKKLDIIWNDNDLFAMISFKSNTKGDVISYLSDEVTKGEIIEGDIVHLNLKEEFKQMKKVLFSPSILDEKETFKYEHFCFSVIE